VNAKQRFMKAVAADKRSQSQILELVNQKLPASERRSRAMFGKYMTRAEVALPSPHFMAKLADVLDVSPDWLRDGTGVMSKSDEQRRVAVEAIREGDDLYGFGSASAAAIREEIGRTVPGAALPAVVSAVRRLTMLERFRRQGPDDTRLARLFTQAMLAPLEVLGLDPLDCDGFDLEQYVVSVSTALSAFTDTTIRGEAERIGARPLFERARWSVQNAGLQRKAREASND